VVNAFNCRKFSSRCLAKSITQLTLNSMSFYAFKSIASLPIKINLCFSVVNEDDEYSEKKIMRKAIQINELLHDETQFWIN
jgi:hypothetical protein